MAHKLASLEPGWLVVITPGRYEANASAVRGTMSIAVIKTYITAADNATNLVFSVKDFMVTPVKN